MLQAEEDQITSGKNSQSADHTDSLLAQEVNRLSVNERIKALEDVHGVSEIEEEDREVLDAKLKELDSEIGQRKNKAYQLAESFSKDYVTNRDFRLMFLRADSYDAKPAAQRMMKFFEYKLKLFGKEKLIKEITLRDLDKDDIDCLRSGAMQELLHKDRAGRRIFFAIHELRTYKHINNLLRAMFYFLTSMVNGRPDVQIRGYVFLFYSVSSKKKVQPKVAWKLIQLRHALPCRPVTSHFCLRDAAAMRFFSILYSIWYRLSPSYARVRVRLHYGSHTECRSKLQDFGIPMECFPTDEAGKPSMMFHEKWLQQRVEIEGEGFKFSTIGSLKWTSTGTATTASTVSSESASHNSNTVLTAEQETETSKLYRKTLTADTRSITADKKVSKPPGLVTTNEPQPLQGFSARMDSFSAPQFLPNNGMEVLTKQLQENSFVPRAQDVLFGRGKPTRNHPGNIQFRNMMEKHVEEYNKAPKFVKCMIAKRLVQVVLSSGSLFLKPVGTANQWVVVDEQTAQDKVSQYFRSRRSQK